MTVEFDKIPALASEIKAWATMYPKLTDYVNGDCDYKELIVYLSSLKTVIDPKGKESQIEYGFTDEDIKYIVDHARGGDFKQDEITTIVQESREKERVESSYVNNNIRDWKDYDVPVGDQSLYRINKHGIFRDIETIDEETGRHNFVTKDVCRTPFIICGVSEPLYDDNIYYKIRYASFKEEIKEFWASQSTLLSRKELKTKFLANGINCPENNILLETVEYISRSIAEFGSRLKKEYSTKQCGWNEDKSLFILGDRALSEKGAEPILSSGAGKGFPELEKKGELKEWVNGAKSIFEYDVVRFKCYDILTAPLKSILGVESHVTDHYGNTSVGKTFTSQLALSMVGDPEGLTLIAKSSIKGILVTVRDFSDLPLLIDESSDAGEKLAELVYPLTSNKGRVTSTVTKEREGGEEYHTTVMFTGEKPIRDCLPNSGQQYRVNELDDTLPTLETKDINKVKQVIRENHGHIIELYLKKIFEMRKDGSLQTMYETCFDKLPATTSNIEGRSKAIFACIMTAGWILEEIFLEIGMPVKKAIPIVKYYFNKCIIEKPVELEYIRALRVILDWIHSDYGRFVFFDKGDHPVELNDRNKKYGFVDYDYIDIIGTEFTKKMRDEGFSPSKIKEDLFKQGITVSNDEKRPGNYRTSRKDFGSYYGIRINRTIAEGLIGCDIKEPDGNEDEEKTEKTFSQEDKIRMIFEAIRLLHKRYGEADVFLLRPILNFSDLDDLLNILTRNGKIFQKSQTSYKPI
jgi:uncharacterized protein (DUF927 family)